MPMVAWYMLSNESYMNRVMRDVLPTVGGSRALAEAIEGKRRGIEASKGSGAYHFVRRGIQAYAHVSFHLAQPSPCSVGAAHLNFFSGLEYVPTDAIMGRGRRGAVA